MTAEPLDVMPRAVQAERALAGALVLSAMPEAVAVASRLAPPAAFTDALARAVVEAVYRRAAAGLPVDYTMVVGDLAATGTAFGAADVTGLVLDAGDPYHVESYARQIAAAALRRELIDASRMAAQWAYQGDEDLAGMTAAIRRLFEPLAPPVTEDGGLADGIARFLAGRRSREGVPTGIRVIDEAAGGIAPGDFVVVAGFTGLGKSHLAVNLSNAFVTASRRVLFASLEMSDDQVIDRLMFNRVGRWFPTGGAQDYPPEVMDAARTLSDRDRIRVLNSARTASAIGAAAIEFEADLVVVDHAQILVPADPRASEYAGSTANAAELMELCKRPREWGRIAVVVLSQISREANRGHALGSRGFGMGTKGTNAWQENADLGILLEGVWDDAVSTGANRAPDAIRVNLAKNRHGPPAEGVYDQDGQTGVLRERPADAPSKAPASWLDMTAGEGR